MTLADGNVSLMESCAVDTPKSKIDWTAVIVAVVTTVGTIVVAYLSRH